MHAVAEDGRQASRGTGPPSIGSVDARPNSINEVLIMKDDTVRAWEKEKSQIDIWKYYGGIGGADKDQMIKIVTWLLTVSTGIVGLYATGKINADGSMAFLLSIGVLVSLLAAFTALLYGGYAAWNWAIADRIAEKYIWKEQTPNFRPIPEPERYLDRLPLYLAKPCKDKVAPVFWVFFVASVVSCIVHVGLLVMCFRG